MGRFDAQEQLAIEYIRRRQQAHNWLSRVLKASGSEPLKTDDAAELGLALNDGRVLCDIICFIRGSSPEIWRGDVPPAVAELRAVDNLNTFISECKTLGLEESSIFSISDIVDAGPDGGGNMGAVLYTLYALAQLARQRCILGSDLAWYDPATGGRANSNVEYHRFTAGDVARASVELLTMDGDAATPLLNFTTSPTSAPSSSSLSSKGATSGSSEQQASDDFSSMQKRRGKFRREGTNSANSTFAERWAFLRNNLIVTRSEVGKGAQKNTSMAARRRFRPFRRGSFAPMAQRKSIIKKRDAETSKGIPLYGGSHGNASAKDSVSHIEQMPGSMEIVGTSPSSMHDHLHLRRKGTALHSSPHLNIRAVAAWLKKIGLLNYEKVFLDHGWDDMTSIRSLLNEEELMRMGITKRGHVLRILKAVADPLFGNTNTAKERVGEDHILDDRKNLRSTLQEASFSIASLPSHDISSSLALVLDAAETLIQSSEKYSLAPCAMAVFDVGAHACRAGFAGDADPRTEASAIARRVTNFRRFKNLRPPVSSMAAANSGSESPFYTGSRAEVESSSCWLRSPFSPGFDSITNPRVTHWDDLELILRDRFRITLSQDPTNVPMVYVESWPASLDQHKSRESLIRLAFERLRVPALAIIPQAPAVLAGLGLETGIVVDIGEAFARTMPVCGGRLLVNACVRSPIAGSLLTEACMRQLALDSVPFRSFAEPQRRDGYVSGATWLQRRVTRAIKEKLCYARQDNIDDEDVEERHRAISAKDLEPQLAKFLRHMGGVEFIDWKTERHRVTESLFNPALIRQDQHHLGGSLHKTIMDAVNRAPPVIRSDLFANIVLVGGSSRIPGLARRLHGELARIAPHGVPMRVIAPSDRENAAWYGASKLAAIGNFRGEMCISRETYVQLGSERVATKLDVAMGLSHDGDVGAIDGLPALVRNLCTIMNDRRGVVLKDDKETLAQAIANTATVVADVLRSRRGSSYNGPKNMSSADISAPGAAINSRGAADPNDDAQDEDDGGLLPGAGMGDYDKVSDDSETDEHDDFQSTLQLL
eukprot:g1578.t1